MYLNSLCRSSINKGTYLSNL